MWDGDIIVVEDVFFLGVGLCLVVLVCCLDVGCRCGWVCVGFFLLNGSCYDGIYWGYDGVCIRNGGC